MSRLQNSASFAAPRSARYTPAASASASASLATSASASQVASASASASASSQQAASSAQSRRRASQSGSQAASASLAAASSNIASARSSRRTGGLSRSQTLGSVGNGSARQSAAAAAAGSRASRVVAYDSSIEQAVIAATTPLQLPANVEIQVGQYRGLHLNKNEEAAFNGPLPISQYQINDDPNPEVLKKRLAPIKYTQTVSIRRLNPPAPPKPGDLIIKEVQRQIPAAPPVVLRQEGCAAPPTPAPLVYRQAPPRTPCPIPQQVVEVEGTPIPPPARRVVLERLPNAPAKPAPILIEKWLPYAPQRRRVVLQRSCAAPPPNPRNLVIEWEQPDVEVERVCKSLGVVDTDPREYERQYGCELKERSELPKLCGECECSEAAASSGNVGQLELEGEVEALRRVVNLEEHGLGEYRRYIQ